MLKKIILGCTITSLAASAFAGGPETPTPNLFSGCSLGAEIGVSQASHHMNLLDLAIISSDVGEGTAVNHTMTSYTNILGNVTAGYHYAFSPHWVAGLVGYFGISNEKTSLDATAITGLVNPVIPIAAGDTISGSIKERYHLGLDMNFGYVFKQHTYFYALTGPTWQSNKYNETDAAISSLGGNVFIITGRESATRTSFGWRVGVGIAQAFNQHWHAHLQVNQAYFGNVSFEPSADVITRFFNHQQLSGIAGVDYTF